MAKLADFLLRLKDGMNTVLDYETDSKTLNLIVFGTSFALIIGTFLFLIHRDLKKNPDEDLLEDE
jgi:hypothetical protein